MTPARQPSARSPSKARIADAAALAGLLPGRRVAFGPEGRRRGGRIAALGPARALVAADGGGRLRIPYGRLEPRGRADDGRRAGRLAESVRESRRLMVRHGLSRWTLTLDGPPGRAARCAHPPKEIRLSPWLAAHGEWSELREAVLREIAHALVGPERSRGHGRVWKAMALALGCASAAERSPPKTDPPRHAPPKDPRWRRKAPRSLRIRVRRWHIEEGDPGHPESCPLTLAASEALEGMGKLVTGVATENGRIRVRIPHEDTYLVESEHEYELPPKAAAFMKRVDSLGLGERACPLSEGSRPFAFTAPRVPAAARP